MRKQNVVTVLAPAKLNLALDVVGLLPNGYHDLDMTMQAITLYERVVLRRSPYLNLRLPGSLVAPNNKNTAIKAALAFFHYTGLLAGVDITIYKNTPVRAGMAGGSADAAAVLVGCPNCTIFASRIAAAFCFFNVLNISAKDNKLHSSPCFAARKTE